LVDLDPLFLGDLGGSSHQFLEVLDVLLFAQGQDLFVGLHGELLVHEMGVEPFLHIVIGMVGRLPQFFHQEHTDLALLYRGKEVLLDLPLTLKVVANDGTDQLLPHVEMLLQRLHHPLVLLPELAPVDRQQLQTRALHLRRVSVWNRKADQVLPKHFPRIDV